MQEAMQNCIQNISKEFISFVVDAVYNITEWLACYAEQLHDHTQPKCYKCIVMLQGSVGCFIRIILTCHGKVLL